MHVRDHRKANSQKDDAQGGLSIKEGKTSVVRVSG